MKKKIISLVGLFIVICMFLSACAASPTAVTAEIAAESAGETPAAVAAPANPEIILATTTSTRDSGLLDVLLPVFEKETGYTVKMVAVGTGAALKMGQEGNADVLLVHAPASEMEYMDGGYGKDRLLVMHNDFVIVGPADDPAGINGSASTVDVFKAITAAKALFVSRGDDSGTNKMEIQLWNSAEIAPEGEWYIKTGQGMGDTLRIASEKGGYTLTDRATYLSMKDTLDLNILYEGDAVLLNIYHVITVNPDKWPNMNYEGARIFTDWLVSPEVQEVIADFGVEKFGQPLFKADAGKAEDEVK